MTKMRSTIGSRLGVFMLCALLLLTTVLAIHPIERDDRITRLMGSWQRFPKDNKVMNAASASGEEPAQQKEAEESCDFNMDEAACLNRRTLAAHTDYIYTQGRNSP